MSEYLIEFHAIGGSVKVTAVDPETLEEVSIIGSVHSKQEQLSALAVRKLQYVIEKKRKK